jgi:hypothetical protein
MMTALGIAAPAVGNGKLGVGVGTTDPAGVGEGTMAALGELAGERLATALALAVAVAVAKAIGGTDGEAAGAAAG